MFVFLMFIFHQLNINVKNHNIYILVNVSSYVIKMNEETNNEKVVCECCENEFYLHDVEIICSCCKSYVCNICYAKYYPE